MDPNILKKLNAARSNRQPCVLLTDLGDGRDRLIYAQDADHVPGALGEALLKALRSGKAATVDIDGHAFFLNPHLPPLRLVVIGAVHIAQALMAIAKTVDFDIEIIDPRTAFASQDRFANATLHAEWPEDVLAKNPLDAFTAMIAVTHDPKIDDMPILAALEVNCVYVGALGSKKTHAARVERLKAAGATEEMVARISSPIGLNIGAASPAEIAVAIMAEIILAVRGPKDS